MNRLLRSLAILAFFLVAPGLSWACSIPVFRYALERWELGPYEVLLFHRGPLGPEEKKLARVLDEPTSRANVSLVTIDLDGKVDKEQRDLWDKHGKDNSLPRLMVRRVDSDSKSPLPPLWTGPFDAAAVRKVVDSPARQKLVKLLAKGEATVFIFLDSGDAKADNAAAQVLDRELALLKKKVQLPEQTGEGPQLKFAVPLRVGFTVLKVPQDDPEEEVFLQMLLHSEEGLVLEKGPIAFPIFGRGRLLCSLQGADLTSQQLTNVVRFLCGACSCQVKELNPGVDLLVSANWLELLEAAAEEEAKTTSVAVEPKTQPEPEPQSAAPAVPEPEEKREAIAVLPSTQAPVAYATELDRRYLLWTGAAAAFMLVIITGVWVMRAS